MVSLRRAFDDEDDIVSSIVVVRAVVVVDVVVVDWGTCCVGLDSIRFEGLSVDLFISYYLFFFL
jgi:hypothetical protein